MTRRPFSAPFEAEFECPDCFCRCSPCDCEVACAGCGDSVRVEDAVELEGRPDESWCDGCADDERDVIASEDPAETAAGVESGEVA